MDELDTGLQARLRECPEHLVRTGQEIYLQTGIQVVRCKNDRQGNELIHALLQLRENKGLTQDELAERLLELDR